MNKKLARVIRMATSLIFGIAILFCCTGCFYINKPSNTPQYEKKEIGDFIVYFYDDYCEIFGTTEQGKSKKFLVIPEFIDGVKVKSLGFNSVFGGFDLASYEWLTYPRIESDMLEKIYFESAIISYPVGSKTSNPKLRKVFYCTMENLNLDIQIQMSGKGANVYYPHLIFEESGLKESNISGSYPANISYYYNYEGAENAGYYWIDDCGYGEKIEFTPRDPIREGYTFGGWYKEQECVNAWSFDSDTLPLRKVDEKEVYRNGEYIQEEVTVYQETILYAKWV